MRKLLTVLSVLSIILISMFAPTAEAADAPDVHCASGVFIKRFCPTYPGEFITISNDGPQIDLEGWMLSDGEGSVTFNGSLSLPTATDITWGDCPERYLSLYPGEVVYHKGSNGTITKGSLKLADTGDQVFLFDPNGNLIDVVYYGTSEPSPPWNGPAVPCRKGEMLRRTAEPSEYGSWSLEVPGSFSLLSPWSIASASPVLYPDDGLEVMVQQVDLALAEICVSTYILENWTLARHLAMAAVRGVDVTLLLEGQPVGGVSENGAALAYYLQENGVDVWVMRSSESFRRYDYQHAKYMVFDGERLLVSSENMADSSFTSNRGWAILVRSSSIARDALTVFQKDLGGKGLDVFPLDISLPFHEGGPGRMLNYDRQKVRMEVTSSVLLSTSPFTIEDTLVNALGGSQERILVQQMNFEEDWLNGGQIMDALSRAADRGVTVRILLDSGFGTKEPNQRVAEALNAKASERGWDLECRLPGPASPFERLHNKGVIIDDQVLVGSANWVDNSMRCNREMALLVRSTELADHFTGLFENDWKGDAVPPVISLPWHFLEVSQQQLVLLDATACHDTSNIAEFAWDLDGDGASDLFGPIHAVALIPGEHNVTLRVTDTVGNMAYENVTVRVSEGQASIPGLLLYAPLPVIALLLLIRRNKRRI